jgi:subtilisin family serine protease
MCEPVPICCTALASVFGTLPTRILRGTILTCFCLVLAQVAAIPEPLGEYRLDRILVKPRTAADLAALSEVHAQVGARVLRQFEWLDDIQVVELPEPETVLEWIKHYEESGLVDFAEPDYLLTVAATPSDPYYSNGNLWHLHNTGQNGGTVDADIDGPEGWDTLNSASEIVVAVIDTGIRYTHEDLAANMWVNPGEIPGNGVDDDGNGYIDDVHGINAAANSGNPVDVAGHGTQVAGLLGAVGNNGLGVTGVAWRVRIMAARFFDDAGAGSVSDAVECIDYARRNGAHIINTSFGSPDYSSTFYNAIQSCRSAGIVLVAAAGNDGKDRESSPFYPASFDLDNIVAVAATTRNDALASYTGYGATSVDLGAPGSELYTTYHSSNTSYISNSGSSFAAPVVAGAIALMKERYPTYDYAELIQRLLTTVDPFPSLSGKCVTGGRLNLASALGPSLAADFDAAPVSGSPPLAVTFTDRSFGAITSWSWDFGDGNVSSEQHPAHIYSWEGTFTVTLTVWNSAGQTSSHSADIAVVANYQITNTTYQWIDPSGMTALSLSNDDVSPVQSLPFTFRFYGFDYTQLYVGANGLIGFANQNLSTPVNTDLPDAATPNNILCPFWDDLNPGAGGSVRIGTAGSAPNRKLVIAWVDVPYAANPPANFTFQVVLEEGTHQIQFHYQNVASGRGPGDQGKSATVGLENASGTVAARYSYNGSTLLSAWEGIYTATAGATGQIEFLDTTPSDTAPRFYRAVAVP